MTFLWYFLGFPNIIPALMCFLIAKWEELPSLQYLGVAINRRFDLLSYCVWGGGWN
jgi:hypothetical protein